MGPTRWRYLGLLLYQRHYQDTQLDSRGKVRKVWLFEFEIYGELGVVPIALDFVISRDRLGALKSREDEAIVNESAVQVDDVERIEQVRSKLLSMDPRRFEVFLKELLIHCGFRDVCVTKFSADGGIDVNATAGRQLWTFENTLIQVQAKRWLHSVGRKEVAELRGSLQPFAKGVVVTTGHFSKAAINEAGEQGKYPIALVDGFRLSTIVLDEGFALS